MNIKRHFSALLAGLLLLSSIAVVPVCAAQENGGKILYQEFAAESVEEVRSIWPANTTQGWLRTCTVEGLGTFNQIDYYNNRNASGGLPEGETMEIQIPGLRIREGEYGTVELALQYALCDANSDINMGWVDDFRVYVSTDRGATWSSGYAGLKVQKLIGAGKTSNGLDAVVYQVVSQDLSGLVDEGKIINRIKLQPYGDYPVHYGATRIHSITVTGYEEKLSQREDQDLTIPVEESVLRRIAVEQMYKVVDKQWITDTQIITYNGDTTEGRTQYYKPGYLYKGPTYSRGVDSTWDMFEASIDESGQYSGGMDDKTVIGMDCINIVSAGLGMVSNAMHHSWAHIMGDDRIQLLGGIENEPETADSAVLIDRYDRQDIFQGYAQLQPGDLVLSQYDNGSGGMSRHIRLATVAPKVVYYGDGTINPYASTVGMTETGGSVEYFWRMPNGGVTMSTQKDLDAYARLHPTFTYLYGTSCRVDKQYTFAELYSTEYLAYTLDVYALEQVKMPVVGLATQADARNITANGFQAIIDSNYQMAKTTAVVTDLNTGKRMYDESQLWDTFTFTCNYEVQSLNTALAGLPDGAYALTLDVTAGPVITVGGERPVTRAFELVFSVGDAAIPETPATLDITGADSWAVNWLEIAFGRGLLSERNRTGFTSDVTRLQFADLAVRAAETATGKTIIPAGADSFTDTKEESILKAKAVGIAGGYEVKGEFEFRPEQPITRQEICVMLAHVVDYIQANGVSVRLDRTETIAEDFPDRDQVADWAVKQVALMTRNNVMGGKATDAGNLLTPNANTTLQEAVTLAVKLGDRLK